MCTTCRTYENKHGCLPTASKSANAPFMFKPVKEEEEGNSKHGMRTRRSRAPVSLRLEDQAHLQTYTFFWSLFVYLLQCHLLYIHLKQLSSLRSGHRRLTSSPTREDQQSRSQPSPSGTSISLRSSSTDNRNESSKKTNKVTQYMHSV